jgi:hypothetical protein
MTPPKKLTASKASPSAKERNQRGRVDGGAMFPVAPPAGDMPADYAAWFADIKSRIHGERLRLMLASNSVMVLLYWDIGQRILQKQAEQGYGTKVIDRLAADLCQAFPDMRMLHKLALLGYPPDMQEEAIRLVLEQAERLSDVWTR